MHGYHYFCSAVSDGLRCWCDHGVLWFVGISCTQPKSGLPNLGRGRSRINSIYMTLYFGGAALGSFIAVYAWKHWGWEACAAFRFSDGNVKFLD